MIRGNEIKTGYAITLKDQVTGDEYKGVVKSIDYFTNEVFITYQDKDNNTYIKQHYLRHIDKVGNRLYAPV